MFCTYGAKKHFNYVFLPTYYPGVNQQDVHTVALNRGTFRAKYYVINKKTGMFDA
jgi:hypothetical protein